ncbi:hypothetical protein KC19_7G120200 [Ceratodon purpureus]|uniref:Galactose oxidase n=1 Tax=Ceratodon purpureus TaxID=3225 RepID=A0A8T0H8T2_CERPU|nr:hypothetical protein KC19_7G120200 [Ceratodon purpureus]
MGHDHTLLRSSVRCPLPSMSIRLAVALLLMGVVAREGQTVLAQTGTWQVLVKNSGLSSMHTAVTHMNTVVFLERTNQGATSLLLPDGKCRNDPSDQYLKKDCYAHSSVMNLANNAIRPLMILTDTQCSAGQFMADGDLQQIGGNFNGIRGVRTFTPCPATGKCDWVETATKTQVDRWYSTTQLLPDQRVIVIGGRTVPSYEFIPAKGLKVQPLQFLKDTLTTDKNGQADNWYPYVHLLPDGTLFIFANTKSIKLNFVTNQVVKEYPILPGGPRNYPSGGSSVMLPLSFVDGFKSVEVLVCGGAAAGAFTIAEGRTKFLACQQTCGRMRVTDAAPKWSVETMPVKRCMGDMLLLPDQNVLIINGAEFGSQSEGRATTPVLTPVLYQTNTPSGRFVTMAASTIPRMYHSTANLLPDGRVMPAGSNSNRVHKYSKVPFPTELRLDAFSPPYLAASQNPKRPTITLSPGSVKLGLTFLVRFAVTDPKTVIGNVDVIINNSPFTTHSYSQGLRMLKLQTTAPKAVAGGLFEVTVTAPPNANVAPNAYYMCWVVNQKTPSKAAWIRLT